MIQEVFKQMTRILKSKRFLALSSGSGFGLAALSGACAAGVCTLAPFPLMALLSTLGLGALVPLLSKLQIPALILAIVLGLNAISKVNRQGNALRSSLIGAVFGGLLVFSVMHIFRGETVQIVKNEVKLIKPAKCKEATDILENLEAGEDWQC